MNRYGAGLTLDICLLTEKTGLAHFSWVVTSISKATWFPITVTTLDEIGHFKDLEAMKNHTHNNKQILRSEDGEGEGDDMTDKAPKMGDVEMCNLSEDAFTATETGIANSTV